MVALNSDFAASKPDTDTKNRAGRFCSLAAESIEEDRRSSRGDTRKKRDYCYDIASVDTAFEYGPFGELIRATGEKKDDFNFRFSTKYEDTETGLLYYGYRYYNTETGRWLSRDPITEQSLLLYAESVVLSKYPNIYLDVNIKKIKDQPDGEPLKLSIRYEAIRNQFSDAFLNEYFFIKNNSISNVDFLGWDITLERGNDTGRILNDVLHQNVCVDFDGKAEKQCFSFAATGIGMYFGSKWLGWNSPKCGFLEGTIYNPDPVKGASISARHNTTVEQDIKWFRYMMNERLGLKDVYSVARHNCRKYAQWEFRDAAP